MKARTFALGLLLTPLFALASTTEGLTTSIEPADAIQLAAASAPDGVSGTFAINVEATGHQGGFVYLNSEADYRDQRCLTIAIAPSAARALRTQLGSDIGLALKGKNILVTGEATRVTIWFTRPNGKPTDQYYYQTHVNVADPSQIHILPNGG